MILYLVFWAIVLPAAALVLAVLWTFSHIKPPKQ